MRAILRVALTTTLLVRWLGCTGAVPYETGVEDWDSSEERREEDSSGWWACTDARV
jgi:hypothetical protein